MLVVFVQFRLILSRRRMFNSKLVAPIRAVASVAALINPGTSTRRYCRPVVPPSPPPPPPPPPPPTPCVVVIVVECYFTMCNGCYLYLA